MAQNTERKKKLKVNFRLKLMREDRTDLEQHPKCVRR